ncbi:MAG: Rieske 2Fe-2S domain-containing protein [Alphaproteobacteria bacterium]|nr:Rieske 2Fe-2S domain-containing protein [Alphaproteobacteria bacterium]
MAGPRKQKIADLRSVGPGTPGGRFLRSFWQPVYASDRLPAGRAVPLRILGEDFTLYRGESGTPYVVGPDCAHRGLALSVGRIEGECISCFYHGWTYDGTGRCVAQPAEKTAFCERATIPAYPTREYLGLIFVYFGEGAPPELPELDVFAGEGIVENRVSTRDWPFFAQLENSVDEVHFNFTHRQSKFSEVGLNDEIPEIIGQETEYGIERIARRGNETRRCFILMPNCMYSLVYYKGKGYAEHLSWRVPVDDDTHTSFIADLVHKSADELEAYRAAQAEEKRRLETLEPAMLVIRRILAGELHIDEVPERPDIVLIQDGVAMLGQRSRDRSKDLLGASDHLVALLRRIWTRELSAIEEGRPIKQWRIPRDLVPTKGLPE